MPLTPALTAYKAGHYREALAALAGLPDDPVVVHTRCQCHYLLGEHDQTLEQARRLRELAPANPASWSIEALVHSLKNNPRQALAAMDQAAALGPLDFTGHDVMTSCLVQLREPGRALPHRLASLRLKDEEGERNKSPFPLSLRAAPAFSPDRPEENLICIALWGSNPCYLHGALANARLVKTMFPGWTCRFMVGPGVPQTVLDDLRFYGAQLTTLPSFRFGTEGMVWRFRVWEDRQAERFLIRDADCVFTDQERAAVEAWATSSKPFHAMRGHLAHSELLLGGMWGGLTRVLPPVDVLLRGFQTGHTVMDQVFLRHRVWPLVKDHILVHDCCPETPGTTPYPPHRPLPPPGHVGQGVTKGMTIPVRARTDKAPLFSVLMTAYNAAPWIKEAVESILDQTEEDLELVVVDDGSTDGTLEVIRQFMADPRVRFDRLPANRGPSAALNRALELARGEYLSVMDADDVAYPQRLALARRWLEENPSLVAVSGGMLLWPPGRPGREVRLSVNPAQTKIAALLNSPLHHGASAFRRRVVEAGIRYREDFPAAQDYQFWNEVLALGPCATFPDIVLKYRLHPAQSSARGDRLRHHANRARANFLRQIGLTPSAEEADAHQALAEPLNPMPAGGIAALSHWINHLLKWNAQSKAFDQDLLAITFATRLHARKLALTGLGAPPPPSRSGR